MREAVIVSGARTAMGKAHRGSLRTVRPDDMAAAAVKAAVERAPGLDPSEMGDVIVAGGTESMSMVPMSGNVYTPNPELAEVHPEVYMGMGLTAENVAQQYSISRQEQDEFALRSHQNAAAAIDAGKFRDQIVPLEVETTQVEPDGKAHTRRFTFDSDEGVRRDTTLEALAKLKPVFVANGTVTAGNASQTTDGAAAVVVMSREKAEALGLKPLARF